MSGYEHFSSVYDLLMADADYDRRAQYYIDLLQYGGCRGGILLDLACGTGNMSVRMAQRGFDVIGIDNSPGMLSVAQQNAWDAGENILYLCQDMRQIDLYGTVDAVICSFDGINHLTTPEDVAETFRRVSLFMNPGAVFVFDVNTPYKHREILAENTFVYDCDSVYCVWQNSTDRDTDTVSITLDIFEECDDGRFERTGEAFQERAYAVPALTSMLEQAGLKVVGIYDELQLTPPLETTQRAFFVAKKNWEE